MGMSGTERLRRLLDERGVEYQAIGDATFWETHDGAFRYKAKSHAEKLMVMTCCSQKCAVMTPEQAIDATLGRGTLSASQVSGAIYAHSIHADCADADWQAIADELNNTLGSCNCSNSERTETCKVDVLNTGDCAGYECSEYIMHCNGCGHEFGHVLYSEDGDVWMSEPPRFCPNCGAKVVDPTTNDVDAEVTDG